MGLTNDDKSTSKGGARRKAHQSASLSRQQEPSQSRVRRVLPSNHGSSGAWAEDHHLKSSVSIDLHGESFQWLLT